MRPPHARSAVNPALARVGSPIVLLHLFPWDFDGTVIIQFWLTSPRELVPCFSATELVVSCVTDSPGESYTAVMWRTLDTYDGERQ